MGKRSIKIIITITIVIVAIIGVLGLATVFNSEDITDIQYIHKINIDSINQIQYYNISNSNSLYNGSIQIFKVVYTPKQGVKHCTIKIYAYDSNNQFIPSKTKDNLLTTNCNDLKAGQIQSGNITIAHIYNFRVGYFKIYVYSNGNLVDKITYNNPKR